MLREYYRLTKPGIVYGNALSAAAGFFVASHFSLNVVLLFWMLVGISLIVACGCVFNNYIDKDIDAKMARTANRTLVRGRVEDRAALRFATVLGIIGTLVLLIFTNALTTTVALFGLFAYVIIYSLWSKRYTLHATTIGAISGAIPPVVGYTAVADKLDIAAVLLFLILVAWQMPHALAIALYRIDDYAAANIPIYPRVQGIMRTKLLMFVYTLLFVITVFLLHALGYEHRIYGIGMTVIALGWLALSIYGFFAPDYKRWARGMFFSSLLIMLAFCLLTFVNVFV